MEIGLEFKIRKVEIYEKLNGKRPYEEWINNFKDRGFQARIRARIFRLFEGNFGDYKSIGDNVYELRFTFGPGFRVYYALKNDTIVLLLIGGDKSSQLKDIEIAKKYWNDYQERLNG